ncbi:hypothetical protein [Desulfosediminicola ganghwensis]|uniref:hypothetical protein n=1 Tax=Desulfosediminicola ganghwensis TaxID=2569540 RepID=UPI0010ACF3FB|nr:hypothetical protein [Desulfosediminicola ganghwensis]
MFRSFLLAVSLSMGWMLSPDVQVRLGNGMGLNRSLFLAALAASTLLSALVVSIIRHPKLAVEGRHTQTGLLVQGLGKVPAASLILCARISCVLVLPTGLLVAAGFAFNEIFVYWFPNFGFAFLLLALIVALQVSGERFAGYAQVFFAIVMLGSMILLCLAGISGPVSTNPVSVDIGFSLSLPTMVGSLLLFLGYDFVLPRNTMADQNKELLPAMIPATGALFGALLLFLFWSMLMFQYVASDHLANTTIPHLITARAIWGDTGRYLIGIAIISGVCAAVNALFSMALKSFSGLARRHLLPGHPPGRLKRKRFVFLFALIIGTMMLGGLAGYQILEAYIQTALLLWLAMVGAECIAAGIMLKRLNNYRYRQGYILGAILILAAMYLMLSYQYAFTSIRVTLVAFIVTAGASALWNIIKPVAEVTPPQKDKSNTTGGSQ